MPVLVMAQVSKYQGKYHATSLAIFGAEKMKTDFEVSADGMIKGNYTIGEKDETIVQGLQGTTNQKGKFNAQVTMNDGTILSIEGNLPLENEKGMISFSQKKIVKSSGSKNISESGATGFIIRLSAEESALERNLDDNGKTHILFENNSTLFTNDWSPDSTVFSITSNQGKTFKKIEINENSNDAMRYFRFSLEEQSGKKVWLADESVSVIYREKKGTQRNSFLEKKSGKIELVSEDDKEIIFKISNLQLKKLGSDEVVRIDGYIHAAKTQ